MWGFKSQQKSKDGNKHKRKHINPLKRQIGQARDGFHKLSHPAKLRETPRIACEMILGRFWPSVKRPRDSAKLRETLRNVYAPRFSPIFAKFGIFRLELTFRVFLAWLAFLSVSRSLFGFILICCKSDFSVAVHKAIHIEFVFTQNLFELSVMAMVCSLCTARQSGRWWFLCSLA